jgi:hypothetical protein
MQTLHTILFGMWLLTVHDGVRTTFAPAPYLTAKACHRAAYGIVEAHVEAQRGTGSWTRIQAWCTNTKTGGRATLADEQ